MKQILFLFLAIIHFANAQQPPILQTALSPEKELLLARAQMSAQTQPHTESYEQEITRLSLQTKKQEDEIKKLLIQIQFLNADLNQIRNQNLEKATEIERLKESLSNVTQVSVKQKSTIEKQRNTLEEQEGLLNIATREIVALQQQQEVHQMKIKEVIANGYKKLEQMKLERVASGI